MGSLEDHYRNQVGSKDAQEVCEYNAHIDKLRALIPKIIAHFTANPPEKFVWVELHGETKSIPGWEVGYDSNIEVMWSTAILLADGRLIHIFYRQHPEYQIHDLEHVRSMSQLVPGYSLRVPSIKAICDEFERMLAPPQASSSPTPKRRRWFR